MPKTPASRVKGSVLVVGSAILILLTVLLLVSLRSPVHEPPVRGKRPGTGGNPEATTRPAPRLPAPATGASAPAPRVLHSASDGGGPSAMPRPAESSGAVPSARVQAPPAVPTEVLEERDPARRAQLMNMHRLATARVRASRLRRRENLLRTSIERAKQDGSWSAEKLRRAEEDLKEVSGGVVEAEKDLERVRTEVGGDIDK